jgi:Flp pilus assembly protein TadG
MMKNTHSKRGSSLAESVMVMLVMLAMTFGLIDFGRLMYTYAFLTNVAQMGTRWASVRGSSCTLLDHCNADGPPGDPNGTDVANWITSQDIGIVNPGLMGISGDYAVGNAPGNLVVVYITYPFTFLPFVLPNTTVNFRVASRYHITN